MGKFGTLVIILIALAGAYFAASQLGYLGGSFEKVKDIDRRYEISAARLVPATPSELDNYIQELEGLNAIGNEKEIVEVKLEVAKMQKAMLSFAQNSRRIDLSEPNCSVGSSAALSKTSAQEALSHAKSALAKQKALKEIEGFSYITSTDFENTIQQVIDSLEASIRALDEIC
ncbi:MAG TPA: hypothetical protein VJG83_00940 [archaeon]|nr:hypothetical protein [archaeon]